MVDLIQLAKETTKYNFHSHTQFCDGRACMEEFVESAIAHGFEHYGFSPHSPISFDSSCNMSWEDVDRYLDEFARLKMKYQGKINLYSSMEIDYIDGYGPAHASYQSLPLDYRIGSVHFIPSFIDETEYVDIDGRYENFKLKMTKYFNDDIESVVRSYFAQSLKLVEGGGFEVIAHCDKIGLNASYFRPGIEDEDWYQALLKRHFEAIMDLKYIIEINTKAWEQHQRLFPHSKFFGMLKKHNVPVLFNSDTHYPELVNAGRDEALALFLNS